MYNYVNLIGVVKSVQEQFVVNNKTVHVILSITRPFKNPEGENESDDINVVFYGCLADLAKENVKVGKTICVKGRLVQSNYPSLCQVIGERIVYLSGGAIHEIDA